jgi:hypothetical protein
MDDGALEGAKLKVGRYVLGAHWVHPTAARQGRAPSVVQQRKYVEKLQRHYDKLYAREKPGSIIARDRKLNKAEAEQHLAELNLTHDRALKMIADAQFGPVDKREVSRRNVKRGKAIRQAARTNKSLTMRGFGAMNLKLEPTVWDERFRDAQAFVDEQIAKNPDHPVMQRWQERMDEIARLERELSPDPEDMFGGSPSVTQADAAAQVSEALDRLGASPRFGGVGADALRGRLSTFTRRRDQGSHEQFQQLIRDSSRSAYLAEPSLAELADSQVYLSADGKTGFVIKDGDFRNLVNAGGEPGAGTIAVLKAIQEGARTGDAFDGFMPKFYESLGFREVGRHKWSDEYAPDG